MKRPIMSILKKAFPKWAFDIKSVMSKCVMTTQQALDGWMSVGVNQSEYGLVLVIGLVNEQFS